MRKYLSILFLFCSGILSAQVYSFVDSFDRFDNSSWQINTYGFDGVGCNMTTKNVSISDAALKITMDKNTEPDKYKPFQYNSGGVQGLPYYKYGYFCSRMKSDIVNGTVSSFFLMNQWTAKDWIHKEIDIEFLGKNLHAVQLTTHLINTKTNSWQNASVTIPLPFSIDQDYHDFCILWTPDSVAWFADKQLLHVEKKFVPDEPMQMLMNHWNADASATGTISWLGGIINPIELPSVVSYDQISVQTLNQYLGSLNSSPELKPTNIKIYPNPANQSVNVAFNSASRKISIELLNAIGQTVYTKQLNGTSNNDEMIDIANLQKGIYLVKVSTDNVTIIEKLIKE